MDLIGIKAGTVSSALSVAPSINRDNGDMASCNTSPAPKSLERGELSESLGDENVNDCKQTFDCCDFRLNGEITRADATSIASLWMNSSKSPSPPPLLSERILPISQMHYTAPSSSGRLIHVNHDSRLSDGVSLCVDDGTAGPEDMVDITDESDNSEDEKAVIDNDTSTASNEDKAKKSLISAASSLMGPDTVLFGQILAGVLTQGDCLALGPIGIEGTFSTCSVQSVRVNDVPVRSAVAGQTATMVLKQVHENWTSRSSVMITAESISESAAGVNVAHSSSQSLDSIYSCVTSNTIGTGGSSDISRIHDTGSCIKTLFPQGASVSAGSGLVLLSPALNPIAYWEFEVRLNEDLTSNFNSTLKVYSYLPFVCVRQH